MFCNAQFIFCLLYYIHIFFSIFQFFLLILFSFQKSGFVSAFIRSASYSNMRLSLIFAGLIFANMRLANLVPTSRRLVTTPTGFWSSSRWLFCFPSLFSRICHTVFVLVVLLDWFGGCWKWLCYATMNTGISWHARRGYPAKRALSAMRKHGR